MSDKFTNFVDGIAIAAMKVTPLTKIDVSENIFIRFDPEDTWLGIYDVDESWYDGLGYVMFPAADLDKLILELQKLKESRETYKAE